MVMSGMNGTNGKNPQSTLHMLRYSPTASDYLVQLMNDSANPGAGYKIPEKYIVAAIGEGLRARKSSYERRLQGNVREGTTSISDLERFLQIYTEAEEILGRGLGVYTKELPTINFELTSLTGSIPKKSPSRF